MRFVAAALDLVVMEFKDMNVYDNYESEALKGRELGVSRRT
jgi:hypothetical protein